MFTMPQGATSCEIFKLDSNLNFKLQGCNELLVYLLRTFVFQPWPRYQVV